MSTRARHDIVIVGGGTAGITLAAQLRRAGATDIAIVDPATEHYYQPLWTLVGAGCAEVSTTRRSEASVMPKSVTWIRQAAVDVDPENQSVILADGSHVEYGQLVMAPGIQLDWDKIPGLNDTLGKNGVSSNYTYDLAPKTWDFIRTTRSGSAIFALASGPIKCGGAAQKIAYLACDYWQSQGVLKDIDVHLVLPSPSIFGLPEFAAVLDKVVARYGIQTHFNSEVAEIDADSRQALIQDNAADTKTNLRYDVMHVVPPQSAPDWVKSTRLADPDNPGGYVQIDKHTMQHTRYPNVFALGDAGSSPNSKTGAAVRKQAPAVVTNMRDVAEGRLPTASYDGYSSCPVTTSRHTMLLAEFDYTMKPHPSIPVINTIKERRDMWYLKKYGLPALYWNLMLKGLI